MVYNDKVRHIISLTDTLKNTLKNLESIFLTKINFIMSF